MKKLFALMFVCAALVAVGCNDNKKPAPAKPAPPAGGAPADQKPADNAPAPKAP